MIRERLHELGIWLRHWNYQDRIPEAFVHWLKSDEGKRMVADWKIATTDEERKRQMAAYRERNILEHEREKRERLHLYPGAVSVEDKLT